VRKLTINREKLVPRVRLWLEYNGKPVIGRGGAEILAAINRNGSITGAANSLSISYRFLWNYLEKMRARLGEPPVETFKGGFKGGGGARLTEAGKILLEEYKNGENLILAALGGKVSLK
jgi:molybdate transport system regulatory protein